MKRAIMRILIVVVLLILLPIYSWAQDYKTILDIPEGETLVDLSATEQIEVQQDLLTATLRYESENPSARTLQNEINSHMKEALEIAQKFETVQASTQGYNVYQYDPHRHKKSLPSKKIWRGSQGLRLKSKNSDDLLELVGRIQGTGLTMNGLNYSISPELLEETRNNLLEAALKKLQIKAQRIAKALDKTKSALLHVTVDSGGYSPMPMRGRAMAMSDMAEMSAPVAAPGQSNVNLTVSAKALIKP